MRVSVEAVGIAVVAGPPWPTGILDPLDGVLASLRMRKVQPKSRHLGGA